MNSRSWLNQKEAQRHQEEEKRNLGYIWTNVVLSFPSLQVGENEMNDWEEVTGKRRRGTFEGWSIFSLPTCSIVSLWRN